MDQRRSSVHNVNEWMKKADALFAEITSLVSTNDSNNTTNCYPQHVESIRKGVDELGFSDVCHFCESFSSKFIVNRDTGLIILHPGEMSCPVEKKEEKEKNSVQISNDCKKETREAENSLFLPFNPTPLSLRSGVQEDDFSIVKKSETIHFKFNHDGKTRRFAIPRDYSYLIGSVKDRVQQIIGQKDTILYWRDDDSLIILECGDDMQAAIDFAESQNKPPTCIVLEASVEKENEIEEKKEYEEIENPRITSRDESRAAFNEFAFICDECESFLAPSNGGRFKCIVCDNYDLCAACVANGVHENHALVRLFNGETIVPMTNGTGGVKNVQLKDTHRCTPSFIGHVVEQPRKRPDINDMIKLQQKGYDITREELVKRAEENERRRQEEWEMEKEKWKKEGEELEVLKHQFEVEKEMWTIEIENYEKLNEKWKKEHSEWEEKKEQWENWQKEQELTLDARLRKEADVRMEEEDREAWRRIEEERAERARTEDEKKKRRLEAILNQEREDMRRIDAEKEEKRREMSRLGEKKKRIEGVCDALMNRREEQETQADEGVESMNTKEDHKETTRKRQSIFRRRHEAARQKREEEEQQKINSTMEDLNEKLADFSMSEDENESEEAEIAEILKDEENRQNSIEEILQPWFVDKIVALELKNSRVVKVEDNERITEDCNHREGSYDGYDLLQDDESGLNTNSTSSNNDAPTSSSVNWPEISLGDMTQEQLKSILYDDDETPTSPIGETRDDNVEISWPSDRSSDGSDIEIIDRLVEESESVLSSMHEMEIKFDQLLLQPMHESVASLAAPAEISEAVAAAAELVPLLSNEALEEHPPFVLEDLINFEDTKSTSPIEIGWPGEEQRQQEQLHRVESAAKREEVTQIPALMEHNILLELHGMESIDEILHRLELYCKHVGNNTTTRKEHKRIFSENKTIDNEMISHIAGDLEKRLKSMRKIVENAILYRKGMIWNRVCELRTQINGFIDNREWLDLVCIDLKSILLTNEYTISFNPIEKVERSFKFAVGQAKSFKFNAKEASSLMRWMAPNHSEENKKREQQQKTEVNPKIDDLFSLEPTITPSLRAATFAPPLPPPPTVSNQAPPPTVHLPFRLQSRQQAVLTELFNTGIFDDHERMVEVCRTAMNLEQAIEMMLAE